MRNFVKIKPSQIGDVTLSFAIRENKILAEFTVEAPNPSLIECSRDGPLHISRVTGLKFQIKIVFLALKIVKTNSVDPNGMPFI